MVAGTELGDLFHHLLLLVDLDGEDPAVLALVVQVLDGLAEGTRARLAIRESRMFSTRNSTGMS